MPTLEQASTWYPTNDPVHGLDHILRVTRMGERLALAAGADVEIVVAAALLHDAEGSDSDQPHSRATHHEASASFARKILLEEGWPEARIKAVEHCIRAHRFRHASDPPQTIEAKVLFDADKLDVLGAFGVARTIAFAIQAGQPIFAEASERFLGSGKREPEEPHSSYHEYLFKLRHVRDRLYTEEARRIATARHEFMVNFYEQLLAEARDGQ